MHANNCRLIPTQMSIFWIQFRIFWDPSQIFENIGSLNIINQKKRVVAIRLHVKSGGCEYGSWGACLKWTLDRLTSLQLSMEYSAWNLILENQKYSSKLISFLSDIYLKFYDLKGFEILLAMVNRSTERKVMVRSNSAFAFKSRKNQTFFWCLIIS